MKSALISARKARRKLLGKFGEACATRYLEGFDWKILKRNLRYGLSPEIDIVARAPCGTTVFIEVKTRRKEPGEASWFESPCQSVNALKQAKIVNVARRFAQTNVSSRSFRFDVILIGISQNMIDRLDTIVEGLDQFEDVEEQISKFAGEIAGSVVSFSVEGASLVDGFELIHCTSAFSGILWQY